MFYFQKNTLPKEDYVIREEIVNFVSERFQEIFNEQDLSVELIGYVLLSFSIVI